MKTPELEPLNKVAGLQVFSYEFCEIFKNTFSIENFRATASDFLLCLVKTFVLDLVRKLCLLELNQKILGVFFNKNA